MKPLTSFLGLTAKDQALLVKAALVMCGLRLALWSLPFGVVRRLVFGRNRRGHWRTQTDSSSVDRIAWAINVCSRYLPAATCLTRAMATLFLLDRMGHEGHLKIGVAKDQRGNLKAHAWVGDLESEPGESDIEAAARSAGAHEIISKLPQGYDSLLGKWFANGIQLSGGEQQRIAMARAYLRQAQMILLDEPTSFMDSWAEGEWFERFRELALGRTAVIVTHRFTIAMRADVIHVMNDGRVIESGSHQELLAQDGFYARSWSAQMKFRRRPPRKSRQIRRSISWLEESAV